MINTEAYQEQISAKLNEWGVEIDRLKARANQANTAAREEFHRQLESLSAKQQTIEEKLQQLKQASGERWEELKQELDAALTAFEQNVEQTRARVQEAVGQGLGWAEGVAETQPDDSEGWAEGVGHREQDSEGWVEGLGHRQDDSIGWPEGQLKRDDVVKTKPDVVLGENLLDKPVISSKDGQIVGKVKEFYLDENLEVITAVHLGSEGFFNLSAESLFHRKFSLVKRDEVSLFGLDAILIKNAAAVTSSDEVAEFETWLTRHELKGREVDTPGGTRIGTIGDIIFDKVGHLVAFKLSRIFVEGPLAKAQTIAREVILDTGREDGILTIDLARAEQSNFSMENIA
jgi:uncharacterized protein YrrD